MREELQELAEALSFTLVEVPHAVYLVPEVDNPFLSVSLGDLRKGVGTSAHTVDAFLQCYIIMVILYCFFGGKNADPKRASFLQIKDVAAELDRHFARSAEQTAQPWQEKMMINFDQIAQVWNNLPLRETNRGSSREETVRKACRFLEKQKLVVLLDEQNEIRTTRRLDDLMIHYYLNDERIAELHRLFAREEEKDLA
ncbi:MAG TPA: hypothetical protein DDW99_02875 [Ruminococcaceae bacterium]|nr:hypothetical protein [Oscillospiraceae bacterium]HBQ46463.1 hypothetical protein [Oscillospiraceae bacterium]